jgi:hypothetical protein
MVYDLRRITSRIICNSPKSVPNGIYHSEQTAAANVPQTAHG